MSQPYFYVVAVTPAAGGSPSITVAQDEVSLQTTLDNLSTFLLPGYSWSCSKILDGTFSIPLSKAQVFDLIEDATHGCGTTWYDADCERCAAKEAAK